MAVILDLLAAAGLIGVGYAWGYIKAWREFRRKLNARATPMSLSPRPLNFRKR